MPCTLDALIKSAVGTIDGLLQQLSSGNPHKAEKLAYWMRDYANFLKHEEVFQPENLIRYKRGQVIKAHFGFNIGNELGGLHYAIVVENDNPLTSGLVTVIPLTSQKAGKVLGQGRISLGNEIYDMVSSKAKKCIEALEVRVSALTNAIETVERAPTSKEHIAQLKIELKACQDDSAYNARIINEINKMKIGSIAHVNQISAISKIRIKDPKTKHDVLYGIGLSDELMDDLDSEIIRIFTKKK